MKAKIFSFHFTSTLSKFDILHYASFWILLKNINDNFRIFSWKFVITILKKNHILTLNLIYLKNQLK